MSDRDRLHIRHDPSHVNADGVPRGSVLFYLDLPGPYLSYYDPDAPLPEVEIERMRWELLTLDPDDLLHHIWYVGPFSDGTVFISSDDAGDAYELLSYLWDTSDD